MIIDTLPLWQKRSILLTTIRRDHCRPSSKKICL